jgi:hypothetical protein
MPSARVRFTTPPQVKAWSRGMKDGEKHVFDAADTHWQAAADVLFDRSQQYVHVITGNLKASGRSRVYRLAKSTVAEIAYGGGSVDYAGYEEARGGDHAYLSRAAEVTSQMFRVAMDLIFDDAMRRSGA